MAKSLKIGSRDILWSVIHFLKITLIDSQSLETRYPNLKFGIDYPEKLESFEISTKDIL